MLILNNRVQHLVCDDVTEPDSIRNLIRAAFASRSTEELEVFYNVITSFPKIIVQNTPSLAENLYNYPKRIEIDSRTEAGIIEKLKLYENEFIILDDFVCNKNKYEMDIYLLKDFLYKHMIDNTLRQIMLNEILADLV